jgi:hypothetical protein
LGSRPPEGESIMMYLDPFRDKLVLERRRYNEDKNSHRARKLLWKIRNFARKDAAPYLGFMAEKHISNPKVRYFLTHLTHETRSALTSRKLCNSLKAACTALRYIRERIAKWFIFVASFIRSSFTNA